MSFLVFCAIAGYMYYILPIDLYFLSVLYLGLYFVLSSAVYSNALRKLNAYSIHEAYTKYDSN